MTDCYDLFAEYYLSLKPSKKFYLISNINSKLQHPHLAYVFKTITSDNIMYVMGYIRSLKIYELYNIIENIVNNNYNIIEDIVNNYYNNDISVNSVSSVSS